MEEPGKVGTTGRIRDRESTWLLRSLWLLPIVLAGLVQYPVLRGGFYVDDYLNLYGAINNGPLEFVLQIHGGHSLVVRNGLFYLSYLLFGLDPLPYLLTSFAFHLANVALLQRALRHFGASPLLAAFGSTLWGVSPVAFCVIGWYSAACQAMLATLFLWVLGDVARASHDRAEIGWGTAIRWCLLLLAGASTFGTGIVLAVISPLVIFALLPSHPSRLRATLVLAVLTVVVPALYALQQHAMRVIAGVPNDPIVALSVLTALEHSLQVARLVVDFSSYGLASLLLGPWVPANEAGMVAIGPFSGRSATWVMGLAQALFAASCVAFAGFLWKGPRQQRRSVSILLLLCAVSYGSIVLARLALYQQNPVFPVQPRYHYLGPMLLAIPVSFVVGWLGGFMTLSSRARGVVAIAFMVAWTALCWRSVHDYSAVLFTPGAHEFAREGSQLMRSIESVPPGSPVFIQNRQPFTHAMFQMVWRGEPERFPGLAGVFVILHADDVVAGRRVYFVESDPERLAVLRQRVGSRISGLVLSQQEARLLQ